MWMTVFPAMIPDNMTDRGQSRRKSRTIPDDTDCMAKAAILVEVSRAASLSGAAQALGLSRSTVSEHIRVLEERMGVALLERTTRQVRLTEEGELLLQRMDVVLDAWGEARALLDARQAIPAGRLRVSAPAGLATTLVAPALAEVTASAPGVRPELLIDDRVRDLVGESIDLAIRMVPLQDTELVARRLGSTPLVVVGRSDAAHLPLTTERDLRDAAWVGHTAAAGETQDLRRAGERIYRSLPTNYRAVASDSQGQLAFVTAGLGLALMPWLLVREAIQSGQLTMLANWHGRWRDIYLIYPARRLLPGRTRRLIDILVERFPALAHQPDEIPRQQ